MLALEVWYRFNLIARAAASAPIRREKSVNNLSGIKWKSCLRA